ncbi:four-helix bundle copper-binding protein [Negadavirga shengliensis]|uniref:Four-helix bundle copper-binding protein n=1 Tax=Negadavirga shengliensis TaxID=1389218 RepID=A0ABV9T486_9BACT
MNSKSELIQILNECAAACNHCADACLEEKDLEKMITCIRTDRVCAELCSSTAKMLSVQFGPFDDLLKFCERVCGICADECEKHDHDHCQECAKACRKCQEACLAVLAS